MPFVSILEALEDFKAGRMLIVVDDEDRENEGDLTVAAEHITPELINFMATHGRGLICLALSADRCDQLELPLISPTNTSRFGTAFCESVDARTGVKLWEYRRRLPSKVQTCCGQVNRGLAITWQPPLHEHARHARDCHRCQIRPRIVEDPVT